MWRNYLTVGLRALAKNRIYAFINIAGLAIGLAACLLLLLYVRYESSYDTWLPDAERTFQVQTFFTNRETGEVTGQQYNPAAISDFLRKDFPQIENLSRLLPGEGVLMRDGVASSVRIWTAEPNFFQTVSLPFLHGDPETALKEGRSIVLTEQEARRLFGRANAVGEVLTISRNGEAADWRVTGILQDVPKNTHQFMAGINMVARFDAGDYARDREILTNWNWVSAVIYGKLRPGTSLESINSQMDAWEKRNAPVNMVNGVPRPAGEFQDWKLNSLPDIHLGDAQGGNDRRTIATFAIIALLILGMACINFVNLATARASSRAREVALRKVLGATRRQLITQFLAESLLLAFLAMLVALALAELLLPALNGFLDASMSLTYFGADGLAPFAVALVVMVGGIGGVYPAFYLTRFQPAETLRANKSAGDLAGSGRLRNALVVGQFAVSIGLMICTALVYSQTVFVRTFDPGYRREGLMQLTLTDGDQAAKVSDLLLTSLSRVEGVRSAAFTSIGVNTGVAFNSAFNVPGKPEPIISGAYVIFPAFFDTMGIHLLAGRNLGMAEAKDDATTPADMTDEEVDAFIRRGINVVLNESAVEEMGFGTPSQAIGKQISASWFGPEAPLVPLTVVGVVGNARAFSARREVGPIVYRYDRDGGAFYVVVRYDDPDPLAVRDRIEAVWKDIVPEMPFDAEFAEDIVAEIYADDEKRGAIFAGFAILAAVIACLGLFGLAAFTAERRTKEIGIRKVLGARTQDIVRLLTWQFSKPVLIANIIAWPAAWWLMRDWLNEFDVRIDLTPAPFAAAGLLALAIAVATIASHAVRVARANPVNALRYE